MPLKLVYTINFLEYTHESHHPPFYSSTTSKQTKFKSQKPLGANGIELISSSIQSQTIMSKNLTLTSKPDKISNTGILEG